MSDGSKITSRSEVDGTVENFGNLSLILYFPHKIGPINSTFHFIEVLKMI